MKMNRLAGLHKLMVQNKRTLEHFDFMLKGFVFDVIFLCGETPFVLMIGIKPANFFTSVPVHAGYQVDLLDDGDFYALKHLLGLNGDGEPFTSYKFLRYLDDHIPLQLSAGEVDEELYALLPPKAKKKVDEERKIYFAGWNDHRKDGRQARNFEKTRIMTGSAKIAGYCRRNNISSMWSDTPGGGTIPLPPGCLSR